MTEEEKEAIDKLSSKKNETTWNDTIRQIKREEITDVVVTRQKYITILLNLLDKKTKEIEELKKPKDKIQVVYGGRSYGKTLKAKDYITKEYISKDKIKDIIESSSYPDFAIQKIKELLEEE